MTDAVSDELVDQVIECEQRGDREGSKAAIAQAGRSSANDQYNFLLAAATLKRDFPDLVEDPAMFALLQKEDAKLAKERPDLAYSQRMRMAARRIRNHYDDHEVGVREGMKEVFKGRRAVQSELESDESEWTRADAEHDSEVSSDIAEMAQQRIQIRERIAAQDRQRLTGEVEQS